MLGLLTHIPSVCIEDTGFGSCVVLVKFLESDMFIDTKSTPIVFRRLYWKGCIEHRYDCCTKVPRYLSIWTACQQFAATLMLSTPPATSTTSRGFTETTDRYHARTRECSVITAVRRLWETISQTGSEEE